MPRKPKGHDTGELPAETDRKVKQIGNKPQKRGEPDKPRTPRKDPAPQLDPFGDPL